MQRSHDPWTDAEERDLVKLLRGGRTHEQIATSLGRSELAVRARLAKLLLAPPVTSQEIQAIREGEKVHEASSSPPERQTEDSSHTAYDSLPLPDAGYQATVDVQQAFHRFHFVYAIVNPQGKVYVGYSQDVWHRIGQHNRNLGAVATRNAGPWFPFAIYCFAAEVDARAMETHVRANFAEYAMRVETSMKEVLAQIGMPLSGDQIMLL